MSLQDSWNHSFWPWPNYRFLVQQAALHSSLGLPYSLICVFEHTLSFAWKILHFGPYKPLIPQHSTQIRAHLRCLHFSFFFSQDFLFYIFIIPFIFATELFYGRNLLYSSFFSSYLTENLKCSNTPNPKCSVWMHRILHQVAYNLLSIFHPWDWHLPFHLPKILST